MCEFKWNLLNSLHHQFFFCMHKMCQIRKEVYKKCEIEIIKNDKYFCINRINLEIESDYKN